MNETILSEEFLDECIEGSLLDQPWVRYPIMLIYLLVFLICLLGNLFTIMIICMHPLMRTDTNFFLANLAAADLLVAIFCILQNMIHIVGFENGNWPLGSLLCKLYVAVLHLVPCTSVGILVCVSLEKYIAVLHPLTAMKLLTYKLRVTVTVLIWIASILINVPYYYTTKLFTFDKAAACGRAEPLRIWVTVSFFVWYVIPVIILGFIYTRIGLLLWTGVGHSVVGNRHSSDSQGSIGGTWQMANGRIVVYQQESLLQVPEDPQTRKRRREHVEGRRKVVRLLFAVVLSFALLTFPHHLRLMHSMWSETHFCNTHWSILLQPATYICLFISSAINPILYAFLSRRFREAVTDILHCRKGVFSRLSRSRNRTLVSDVPDNSRSPSLHGSPQIHIRLNPMR